MAPIAFNLMKFLFLSASLALIVALFSSNAPAQSRPPAVYVAKGACPFECCTYRKWKVEKTTRIYARPDTESAQVGIVRPGGFIRALTGEVTSIPGKLIVTKAHGKYKPGDVLWFYTPQGEGFFTVWFDGKMYDEELDYMSSKYEKSTPTCEETPSCWAKLERDQKVHWWVKVKLANGKIGWTDQAGNFGNKDSCG